MAVTTYTVIDGEVVSQVASGIRRDYLPDPLGSTIGLLDNAQSLTDTWEYWPYGEARVRTGATATPFQYVGTLGYFRDSSSRTYVRARHLKTGMGRWTSVDSLWPTQHQYGYALQNPLAFSDYYGLQVVKIVPTDSPGTVRIYPTGGGNGVIPGKLQPDCTRTLLDYACPFPNPLCIPCLGVAADVANRINNRLYKPVCVQLGYRGTVFCFYEYTNEEMNAMRHCVWGCLAASSCGCDCAMLIDLKELKEYDSVDSGADWYNNGVGRYHGGPTMGPADCTKACDKSLRSGDLFVVPPGRSHK